MHRSGNNSFHAMVGYVSHITTALQSWPSSRSHQMWAEALSWLPTVQRFYEQLETIMVQRVLSRPERSSQSDDRCLSLRPLRSKWKLKANGLSYGSPALPAHMYQCTDTPTLLWCWKHWRVAAHPADPAEEFKGIHSCVCVWKSNVWPFSY